MSVPGPEGYGIRRIAVAMVFGPLVSLLDSTVVSISLFALSEDLGVSLLKGQWVVTGYLLALALSMPMTGWLVNRIGARRLYIGALAAFIILALFCAVAPTADQLILSRAVQGLVGGVLAPMGQMMIARHAGKRMAGVMGFMSLAVAFGPILGPVLAGAILQFGSWRMVFLASTPFALAGIVCSLLWLPKDGEAVRTPLDWAGLLLISPGLVLFINGTIAISGRAGDIRGWAMCVAGCAMVIAFIIRSVVATRTTLLDIKLLATPPVGAAAGVQFFYSVMVFGGQLLLPLYFVALRDVSPAQTGMLLAPLGLGMLAVGPLLGRLYDALGARLLALTGALFTGVGVIPLALAPLGLSDAIVAALLFIRGVGLGLIAIPTISAALAAAPKHSLPIASTTLNVVQRVGGPVGSAAVILVLQAKLTHGSDGIGWQEALYAHSIEGSELVNAFTGSFWLLAATSALTAVFAARLTPRPRAGPDQAR